MIKHILLGTLLTISSSLAISLDEMVDNALSNNRDLKSLETAIEVANEQIKISTNWKNPTITLGANDIQFDNADRRDLEAMQAEYIGFSQIIPIGDKLQIQKEIANKQSNIAKYTLEERKLQLKSKIYEYAYTILILERKYTLLNKYQKNIQSLEKLSNALYENGKMNQADVINIKVAHSKIELKKINLNNLITNLYLKLEEITYTKNDTINASLLLENIQFQNTITNHPKILMTQELSAKFKDISKYEIASKTSDVKLNVAYFSRDSKFEDYANVSVNIPVSLYGTENVKAVKAKLKSQEISNKVENLKQKFKTTLLRLQNNLDNAIKTHNIIKDIIIPLKEDIQMNLESYNSFNQVKPQKTIRNLNEVISYELQLLDEVKKYFTAYAQSIYYTQGKQ